MLKRVIQRVLAWIPSTTIPNPDGTPYLTRYYLLGGPRDSNGNIDTDKAAESRRPFNVFLHRFHSSDRDRGLHNHPWPGISLILRGGYVEHRLTVSESDVSTFSLSPYVWIYSRSFDTPTKRTLRAGNLNSIGRCDFHRVTLLDERRGCWTLFLAGKRFRGWGFLDHKTGVFTSHKNRPGAVS